MGPADPPDKPDTMVRFANEGTPPRDENREQRRRREKAERRRAVKNQKRKP